MIPQKATYEIQDKKFVYVVDKNSKVASREVKVAPQDDGTQLYRNLGPDQRRTYRYGRCNNIGRRHADKADNKSRRSKEKG